MSVLEFQLAKDGHLVAEIPDGPGSGGSGRQEDASDQGGFRAGHPPWGQTRTRSAQAAGEQEAADTRT